MSVLRPFTIKIIGNVFCVQGGSSTPLLHNARQGSDRLSEKVHQSSVARQENRSWQGLGPSVYVQRYKIIRDTMNVNFLFFIIGLS